MGVRICPQCGGKVAESRNECPHCGYDFKKNKKCPECEEMIDIHLSECPICGHIFEEEVTKEEVTKEEVKAVKATKTKKQTVATDHKLAVFKKTITKEEFLRMAIIELSKNEKCPSDILNAKLGDIEEGETEFIYASCVANGTYTGTVGYDRQEEYVVQEYGFVGSNVHYTLNGYPRVGTGERVMKDVTKTRTVTDWRPHSGSIVNEDHVVTFVEDYSPFEKLFRRIFQRDDLDSLYEESNDTENLSHGLLDKGKELLDNQIRGSIAWPGDHVKEKVHSIHASNYEFYRCVVPTYKLSYEYEGVTLEVEGLAIDNMTPVVQAPASSNSNSVNRIEILKHVKTRRKEKIIDINKIVAIVLFVGGICGFVFTIGSPAFLPVILSVLGALLVCLGVYIYAAVAISSINNKCDKQKQVLSYLKYVMLIEELQKRNLPELTDDEKYDFHSDDYDGFDESILSDAKSIAVFTEEEKKAWAEIREYEYDYRSYTKEITTILSNRGLLGIRFGFTISNSDDKNNKSSKSNIICVLSSLSLQLLSVIFMSFIFGYNYSGSGRWVNIYDVAFVFGRALPILAIIFMFVFLIILAMDYFICLKNKNRSIIILSSIITILFGAAAVSLLSCIQCNYGYEFYYTGRMWALIVSISLTGCAIASQIISLVMRFKLKK